MLAILGLIASASGVLLAFESWSLFFSILFVSLVLICTRYKCGRSFDWRKHTSRVDCNWESESKVRDQTSVHHIRAPRRLGLVERWFAGYRESDFFVAMIRVRGQPPTPAQASMSAIRTMISHPILRLVVDTVHDPIRGPFFLILDGSSLRETFPVQKWDRHDELSWQEVFDKELRSGFDHNKLKIPLWRLNFVWNDRDNFFEILLSIDRCLADEETAFRVLASVVSHLEELKSHVGDVDNSVWDDVNSVVDVGLPLDAFIDFRPSPASLCRKYICSSYPRFLSAETLLDIDFLRRVKESEDKSSLFSSTPRVHFLSLPKNVIEGLRDRCRKRKATLQSAIIAASCFAFSSLHGGSIPRRKLLVDSSVSLRGRVSSVPSDEDGNYHVQCEYDWVPKEGSDFWDVACRISSQFSSSVDAGILELGSLSFVTSSFEKYIDVRVDSGFFSRTSTVSVSHSNFPSDIQLRHKSREIDSVFVGSCADLHGPVFYLSSLIDPTDGSFRLCVSHPSALLQDKSSSFIKMVCGALHYVSTGQSDSLSLRLDANLPDCIRKHTS